MFKSAATVVAFAAVGEAQRIKNPIQTASRLNENREVCNLTVKGNDGIKKHQHRIQTELKYKNYLLAHCESATNKTKKLSCIEGNVGLKTGRANYVSYRGARLQRNHCARMRRIKGCTRMCVAFF